MKKLFFAAMAALGLLASCDKELDIQQAYSFSLETMPVPKRIGVGETAEIRCTLVREGAYADARYTIRYFQPDGKGELRMDDGTVFLPNDRYPLDIDNEELNSLLTTIKNQGDELELKNKEISKLQNMLARLEKKEGGEAPAKKATAKKK